MVKISNRPNNVCGWDGCEAFAPVGTVQDGWRVLVMSGRWLLDKHDVDMMLCPKLSVCCARH
jgi:hypothetical protein